MKSSLRFLGYSVISMILSFVNLVTEDINSNNEKANQSSLKASIQVCKAPFLSDSRLSADGTSSNEIQNVSSIVEAKIQIPEPLPEKSKGMAPMAGEKYVFFRNFDPWSYLAYQQYLEQSEFNEDFLYADFSDDFFANNKITDFECAVFPLGNFILNATTPGGHVVIDKIMEMYNKGKKVIITGRVPLYGLYRTTQGDVPEVKNFIEDILGIQYIGFRPTSDTVGTLINILPYTVKGAPAEPITFGAAKHCNITYNGQSPLTLSLNIDVFKLKQSAIKSFPQDHLIETDNTPLSDTLVGCRYAKDSSKIVFWSFGFDYVADVGAKSIMIVNAIKWFFREAPGEGANIELLPWERYNFGSVKLGDSAFADVIIHNSGVKDLIISKIVYGEWAEPGIFSVVDGIPKTPITIKPDAAKTFTVKFTPKAEDDYREYLEITSNAVNYPTLTAWLEGKGGSGGGAKLQVNLDSINFGDVAPLKQAYEELVLKNTGDREVVIGDVRFLENTDNAFNFTKGTPTPTLNPGQEQKYEIRFVPQAEGKTYKAIIRIWATPINPPEILIPVTGKGSSKTAIITVIDNFDFGNVAVGEKVNNIFDIKNDGEADLVISSISLTGTDAPSFTLEAADTYPITIGPQGTYPFTAGFQPAEAKKHFANIRIESNASNDNLKNITISGTGIASDVSDPWLSGGSLKISVLPNPVCDEAEVVVESGELGKQIIFNSASVYISDVTGTRIKDLYYGMIKESERRFKFDTKGMSKGLYFIIVKLGSNLIAKSVVVM